MAEAPPDEVKDPLVPSMICPNSEFGLRLFLEDQEHHTATYKCAFVNEVTAVSKAVVVTTSIEGQHMRCHELQEGQSIWNVLSTVRNSDAKAVLLINTEDTLVLNPEFSVGFTEKEKKLTIPVLLLRKTPGNELMSALRKCDKVIVKVDVETGEDVLEEETTGMTQHSLESAVKEGQGFRQRIYRHLRLKPPFDLKGQVNKLFFSDQPIIFSQDDGNFIIAMAAFANYENEVNCDFYQEVSDILKKLRLQKLCSSSFSRDFPFYILLAHRMHKGKTTYKCSELELFQRCCITELEALPRMKVAEVFNAFVDRGDFKIMFRNKEATSVFNLLESACSEMAKVSQKLKHQSTSKKVYSDILRSKMMWVSLALRLHSERDHEQWTFFALNMWKNKIVVMLQDQLVFDTDTCCALKEGLEFGRMINLHSDLTFDWNDLEDLLTRSSKACRPFQHVMKCVLEVKEFLSTGGVLAFCSNLRAAYFFWLSRSSSDKLSALSEGRDLSGALEEGLHFVDELHTLLLQSSSESVHVFIDSECVAWLELLLNLIDITGDDPTSHLKPFIISGSKYVCKKYHSQITKIVIANTECNFKKLTVEQVLPLFKEFKFWTTEVLEKYLDDCRILPKTRIEGPTWRSFVKYLMKHAPDHLCLFKFLKRLADHYLSESRAEKFVLDLIVLDVPELFATGQDDEHEEVKAQFDGYLRDYVRRIPNAQKSALLAQMSGNMDSISEKQNEFQQLVLLVIQQEVMYLPEVTFGQAADSTANENLNQTLQLIKVYLCENDSWYQDLTSKQRFCWGLIVSCCSKLRERVAPCNFDWLSPYASIIRELGMLFTAYCNSTSVKCILRSTLPDEIMDSHCGIKKLFECMKHIQDVLRVWQEKIRHRNITYDDIILYASNASLLFSLGNDMSCQSLVVEGRALEERKNTMIKDFERLNEALLKYIPGHPDAKWCALHSLLAEYGVLLPTLIYKHFSSKSVIFPDEEVTEPVQSIQVPSQTGAFNPRLDISLRLAKDMHMDTVSQLVQNLKKFLEPLMKGLDMLVFFTLLRSVLFKKYLEFYIRKTKKLLKSGSTLPSSQTDSSIDQAHEDIKSLNVLVKSLQSTKNLIFEIMQGEAQYVHIIAEGELDLNAKEPSLDIDKEFGILSDFLIFSKVPLTEHKKINGIRSLLEFFQYATHIENILKVLETCTLEGCLNDPDVKKLRNLSEKLKSDEYCNAMTPRIAIEEMSKIKQILCIAGKESSSSLKLFAAMRTSVQFYLFVRSKDFVGAEGQDRFYELRQLINAQLQHEEYNETVLHHLYGAFRYMGPFMDEQQNLQELMKQVTALDTTDCAKQLETVNSNITLIQLWFARAEGDTLENVGQDLTNIIRTGTYYFSLAEGESEITITLEYIPSSPTSSTDLESANAKQHMQQHDLLDSGVQLRAPNSERPNDERPNAERWNSEQINDFVRKLGFLDSDKSDQGDDIKTFLHINEVAYKLLKHYVCLRDLGHPTYIKEPFTERLLCQCDPDHSEANKKVEYIGQQLNAWNCSVTLVRAQYEWLVFFSIPKLLILYKLLDSEAAPECIDRIVQEISFLCCDDETSRKSLRAQVEGLSLPLRDVPMEAVGDFLRQLFVGHALPHRCVEKIHHQRRRITSSSSSIHNAVLHICHGYTQKQVIQVIVGIYDGVPESFEVFCCRPTSTEEELRVFLSRAKSHPLTYLVLEVNKLSCKLQEILMHLNLMPITNQETKPPDESPVVSSPTTSLHLSMHFIETAPSLLREIPSIQQEVHKDPPVSFEEACRVFQQNVFKPEDFQCIELVYGSAGDGKTHYIKQQLPSSPASVTIAINEAFTPLSAIKKLRDLPLTQKNCAIFFNFTTLPPEDRTHASKDAFDTNCDVLYMNLMEITRWFFFNLFVLGYVEDQATGLSFRIPGGLQWAIYIEVPSHKYSINADKALKLFKDEVPVLALLTSERYISPDTPYLVDEEVKLVCKYLRALREGTINKLYTGGRPVKFSNDAISVKDCQELLVHYMPHHIRRSKVTQRLFIKYMNRRCAFLENLPGFNYNPGAGEYKKKGSDDKTDTTELGSTLMKTMLHEVEEFCDPVSKHDWSMKPHQQLIYDFKDGGASIGLITLSPEKISEADKTSYKKIGVEIPALSHLHDQKLLDRYLSRALNVELKDDRLSVIDESNYVLTIDYTIKMLNIHERCECGVPVIIEGETGVGKTALVEMLSKLWNHSQLQDWMKTKSRILEFLQRSLGDIPTDSSKSYPACVQTVENMSSGDNVKEEDLLLLCQLPDSKCEMLYNKIQKYLQPLKDDSVLALLTLPDQKKSFVNFFTAAASPEATASLLYAVLTAQVKSTFHKINVHAALTPSDIISRFKPVIQQAEEFQRAFDRQTVAEAKQQKSEQQKSETTAKVPFVTVFLDEVNTSSCLGLFKEIIVDRSSDGKPIPENVFIVAACNPHRGNSTAVLAKKGDKEAWMRGSYYVRRLHPTLHFLMWDYGSLSKHQERDYISAKMKMLDNQMPNSEVGILTNLILSCQDLMRDYAKEHLELAKVQDAALSARSCVSQRDIQRVFILYQWFMSTYTKLQLHGEHIERSRRALLVSLGIVYYMRLNNTFRKKFTNDLDGEEQLPGDMCFMEVFNNELDWYIANVILPSGIAHTRALKENLFATIVCCTNHIPLIIVGAPGSSKTLSFNQAIANLKGQESKMDLFRKTDIFPSLDPQYYQCSRRTTSTEIETVFSRAVNRQRSHKKYKLPINCVVFMDEAGLPEESHESLKVLHSYLDEREVSFVAITNHVLDAAKTNRAISLYRPESPDEDLETLAKGCFCSYLSLEPEGNMNTIVQFCDPYSTLMSNVEFRIIFGLRDFIHFISYLRRKCLSQGTAVKAQIVMEALERNFSGSEKSVFLKICDEFLKTVHSDLSQVKQRGVLSILKDSLHDRPQHSDSCEVKECGVLSKLKDSLHEQPQQNSSEHELQQCRDIKLEIRDQRSLNEVRYKLIIDPSEDDSVVRFLFSFGILNPDTTDMYVCSDFPGDSHIQKINTIAAIRHSAIEGHTVILSQTDDIHESFYDLFNQRFRMINDPKKGTRYYTNIAIGAHLKLSRVHPNFQCVVVLKKSEVENTPAPFLNRFEKFFISHSVLLETVLRHMTYCFRAIVNSSKTKTEEFVNCISADSSLYGFKPETLDSLLLSVLPFDHTYQPLRERSVVDDGLSVQVYLMKEMLQALRHSAGFNIPACSLYELSQDAKHIFAHIVKDATFDGAVRGLNHIKAFLLVTEAMKILNERTDPQDSQESSVSPGVCMVIAVFQQWLVRYLCKKLMQLMTPEALILHRNKIPYSYLEHYLAHQSHFSLKELVHAHLNSVQKESISSPNKLLCFTRSSRLIHQLPNMHPSTTFDTHAVVNKIKELENLVFAESDKLFFCKLSRVSSQSSLKELLKTFASLPGTEVCVLVANMQDTSRQVVNHIRIMIEEIEKVVKKLYPQRTRKLYVFLLHFPPAQLFDACYPSCFMKEWDHYYLDTISHKGLKGVVDIQDWFLQCCFPKHVPHINLESDSLMQTLREILTQSVHILTSKVDFGSEEGRSFNCPMNGAQRNLALQELLDSKGIGHILCKRFRGYWTHSNMVKVLNQSAAMCSKKSESSISITDLIQMQFKEFFYNFLAYMLSKINENCNLDLLFDDDCTPPVVELFAEILRVFPIPEFSELSTNLPIPELVNHTPHFPFFHLVYSSIESIVEQSQPAKGKILTEEQSTPTSNSGPPQTAQLDELKCNVTKFLLNRKGKSKDAIVLAIEGIEHCEELWERYFSEFNLYKLRVDSPSDGIAQEVFAACFGALHQQEALVRMVGLHCHVFVHHLDLSKLATLLRPLGKIHKMHLKVTAEPSVFTQFPLEPSHSSMPAVVGKGQTSHSMEHLAVYVITTLFNALTEGLLKPSGSNIDITPMYKQWLIAYRDVLYIPNLKKGIYDALYSGDSCELLEAQLSIMHATFLFLQTSDACVLDDDDRFFGRSILLVLLNRHFTSGKKLRTDAGRPTLFEIAQIAEGMLSGNRRLIINEGLLSHFFSAERQSYHKDDVKWFLEQANMLVQQTMHTSLPEHSATPGHLAERLCSEVVSNIDKSQHPTSQVLSEISLNVLKLYMVRVLYHRRTEERSSHVQWLRNNQTRLQVGEVLCSTSDLGDPGPYIPIFYQSLISRESTKNQLMQQPLAHLYFLTVLEHLMSTQHTLAGLVITARSIEGNLQNCHDKCTKAVLWIELQAVIQVLAQKLAKFVTHYEIGEIQLYIPDLNHFFGEESLVGGAHGHGMVVALHMIKQLKSTRQFSELMRKQFDTVCERIDCLKPFKSQPLKCAVPKPHLFPFLVNEADRELRSVYDRVKRAMMHEGTVNVDELVQIAMECKMKQETTFRMLVWLVAYYEFYEKKKFSKTLKDCIGSSKLAPLLLDECCVRLIQAFLYPSSHMINKPELPHPSKDEEHTDGRPAQPEGVLDPLYQLFTPQKQDPSDVDLCCSLANLVAAVLGSPSRSNHLWHHIFAPDHLKETYLTGFMYDSKIGTEGLLYDCGVELTEDGLLGRQDYKQHANRGTYSLHSLYFLLWANFGSFCISLLTQPEAEARLHGPIISKEVSVRHFCVSQLRSMWRHMRDSLGLSEEERSFFVMRLMWRLYRLKGMKIQGILKTRKDLDEYENLWHKCVYQHTVADFKAKYIEYSRRWLNDSQLRELKRLESCYPFSPQERDFTHSVVAHVEPPQQSSAGGELSLLFHFATEWSRLHAGGLLLPDLVELYVWIHTNLAYQATIKVASSLSIGEVMDIVSKRFGDHLSSLYKRVKEKYAHYISLAGGVLRMKGKSDSQETEKIIIADDISLLKFLSVENKGSGWLLSIIEEISSAHNTFIESLRNSNQTQQNHRLERLLPDKPVEIFITEVNEYSCIVGDLKSFHGVYEIVQLIRSRYPQPSKQNHLLLDHHRLQMTKLEEDVVANFVAGKPLIKSLRKNFNFLREPRTDDASVANFVSSGLDEIKLSPEFQVSLEETLRSHIEYAFHSADYNTLVGVHTGLETVIGYLSKSLKASAGEPRLEEQTVATFMMSFHKLESKRVLNDIGISTLSPSQVNCLTELSMPFLWSCLNMFAAWIKKGTYEFSYLPYPLKTRMSKHDRLFVKNELKELWFGPQNKLLSAVEQTRDFLTHSEKNISEMINRASQESAEFALKPIADYLKESVDCDKLLPHKLIPCTILLQHYVSFRMALKRLLQSLREELKANEQEGIKQQQWHEFVDSLWNEVLPQFRPVNSGTRSSTNDYGFKSTECPSKLKLSDDFMDASKKKEKPVEEEHQLQTINELTSAEEDQGSVSLEEKATIYTPEMVADFLRTIDMDKYVAAFLDIGINGDLLLDPDGENLLQEMGVLSAVDRVKLKVLFKRHVLHIGPSEQPDSEIVKILEKNGMAKYKKNIEKNNIDCGMILEAEKENFLNVLMKEIGVASAVDRLKLQIFFRRALRNGTEKYPLWVVLEVLEKHRLGKYTEAFKQNEIDGDMILEADTYLLNEVMQEISVKPGDMMKIKIHLKKYVL